MRILMVAPQPFFQPRGTPFSVLHRLKALSKLGYEVDLVTYHIGQDVEIEGVKIHRIREVPFIKKIAIGPSKRKIILDIFLYLKVTGMLKRKHYDLIHSHEEAGFFAPHLARRFGTLHLYDMHSSLPQQLSNFKSTKSKLIKTLFEKLEAYTIRNTSAVITICPELHRYVASLFPDKVNSLIENVADNGLVFKSQPDQQSIEARIKSNGDVVILYTGTFEPYQGLDLLIESGKDVIEKEKNVRFVLVGGKPEQVLHYKEKARSFDVGDHFIFTGSVSPEEVPAYIESSDILVSPRMEGNNTPLKIYSYLRSGKPIVATRHLTHTQVLNDDVSVLTETTAKDFGAGLLSVLGNPELRVRIVSNARKLAEDKYSYKTYLEKTQKLYAFLERELDEKRGLN